MCLTCLIDMTLPGEYHLGHNLSHGRSTQHKEHAAHLRRGAVARPLLLRHLLLQRALCRGLLLQLHLHRRLQQMVVLQQVSMVWILDVATGGSILCVSSDAKVYLQRQLLAQQRRLLLARALLRRHALLQLAHARRLLLQLPLHRRLQVQLLLQRAG